MGISANGNTGGVIGKNDNTDLTALNKGYYFLAKNNIMDPVGYTDVESSSLEGLYSEDKLAENLIGSSSDNWQKTSSPGKSIYYYEYPYFKNLTYLHITPWEKVSLEDEPIQSVIINNSDDLTVEWSSDLPGTKNVSIYIYNILPNGDSLVEGMINVNLKRFYNGTKANPYHLQGDLYGYYEDGMYVVILQSADGAINSDFAYSLKGEGKIYARIQIAGINYYSTVKNGLYGNNSANGNIQIENVRHLDNIRYIGNVYTSLGTNCYQTKDIDGSGVTIAPIASSVVTSSTLAFTYDGGKHMIYKLNVEGKGSGGGSGLFDTLGKNATVQRLGIANCTVLGSQANSKTIYAGMLAGINNGSISTCYTTSGNLNIKSQNGYDSYWAGALVGRNDSTIKNCYSNTDINFNGTYKKSSSIYAGGIAGVNSSNVYWTYNIGTITANSKPNTYNVGAIAGRNTGNIVNGVYVNTSFTGASGGGSGVVQNVLGMSLANIKTSAALNILNNGQSTNWFFNMASSYLYPQLVLNPHYN